MDVEYVRSLNCNYERILLREQPQEQRYQYCILGRGGVKGLLPCNLRYINGDAYLYYDITSRQDITHIYDTKSITRVDLIDFAESLSKIQLELDRFLLDFSNLIWSPTQIFKDLEKEQYSFLYVPYCEEDTGIQQFMEFLVDKVDYQDEPLVNLVYKMYEQWEMKGLAYFTKDVFEDVQILEVEMLMEETESDVKDNCESINIMDVDEGADEKKGIFGIFEAKRNKNRKAREEYQQLIPDRMSPSMVAEETIYEGSAKEEAQEYGRTIYIESTPPKVKKICRLYSPEGEVMTVLEEKAVVIGKAKQEVDVVLDDASVSRMHAKIVREENIFYVEDLNSTNGTYKNGLRLNPYEKRKLDVGDEVKFGRLTFIFK